MKIRKKLGMSLGGIKQKEDKMKILNPYEKIRLANVVTHCRGYCYFI